MPELPEVETVRRGLLPALEGRRIERVEVRRPDLRFPFPERFAERLTGRRFETLGRRAKYLIAELDSDDALVMHLGMTGRFTVARGARGTAAVLGDYTYSHGGDPAHDHVVLHIAGGTTVTYNDARRFGFMTFAERGRPEACPYLAGLGVEPLGNGLSAAYLAEAAHGKRCDLKAFLLDQRIVAGLGNIYVCEVLHRAGLKPIRSASILATRSGRPKPEAERVVVEIRAVLEEAIRAGGSTLRDYKTADGEPGAFQESFAVYGRDGLPCLRPGCRGIVRRKIQGGRSTFACPACQR